MCLYYRGACITEVPVLQRCLYYRGACITEVPVLQRCLYYRGACITEVPVLQRCLYYRGACITEVAVLHSTQVTTWSGSMLQFETVGSTFVGCVEMIVCWCPPPCPTG